MPLKLLASISVRPPITWGSRKTCASSCSRPSARPKSRSPWKWTTARSARTSATACSTTMPAGRGVVIVTEAVLKQLHKPLAGSTVALQGFGNVGSFAARFLHEAGAKVVGITDLAGGVWNPEGLDVAAVLRWSADHKGVAGF